ncbi:CoA transferase [Candidatus Poriferisocius sp.]|uniref:CaiB/BaiF CoA-transferase family protein n=1 Tax=Candidatus Poriferisocius sp. TaxID=3101276 RepID=UPI003B593A0E
MVPNGDLRVLQLQGGIEVAFCAKILADSGADVAVVEPTGGHPLRGRGDGSLYGYLHGGKRSILGDAMDPGELASGADVVVTDAIPGGWERFHARHPHVTVVVITPYGLEGPWADRPATDLTLQAGSGGMAPRGALGRAPLMVGGEPTAWFAGSIAAVSVLAAMVRQRPDTEGELIDVSMFEAAHLEHGMHPVTFASIAQRPFQTTRGTPVPGIEPTADGHVGFFVITGQQWLDFCSLVGQPQWAEDDSLFIATTRRERADELLGPIRAWTATQTTAELVELASSMRIPVAPIGTGATLPEIDQFVAEEWFVVNPDGFLQPRRPYRVVDEPVCPAVATDTLGAGSVDHWDDRPNPAGSVAALPLAGLRVADFSGFWAGPMASGILAGFGAEVIHVEGPRRPDGIRMNSIRSMSDDQWWEWSPLFCGANTNKLSLTLDLATAAGRDVALALLGSCDVMVENFSPRVVDQIGLDADAVLAANPNLVVVRMPAFGLHGPWRDRVGFAQTIEQAVGLAYLTGYVAEEPVIPNGMCDPLAGVFGAIAALVGLAERDRRGEGMVVESPMVGAGLATTAEQVIDFSLTGRLHQAMGNRSPLFQQDVYPASGDDEWLAVSLPDDLAMTALAGVVGSSDPDSIAKWCVGRRAGDASAELQDAGVPVAPVVWAHQVLDNPQLVHRGFFEEMEHPVCGTFPVASWPARFGAGPHRWNRAPSPTLGQHNRVILDQLGFAPAEIDALYEAEVLADRVLSSQKGW